MKAVDIACHFRWHGNFSDVGKCGGDPPLRQIVGQAEHRVFMIKGTSWVSRLCSREESSFIRSRSFSAVSSLVELFLYKSNDGFDGIFLPEKS